METAPLRKTYGITPSLWIVIVLLVLILSFGNYYLATHTEIGTSFYSYWLSGRVLFAQGENPYSGVLFEQVNQKFPDVPNRSGFVLPVYALLLVGPLTFINEYQFAFILWMFILEAALIYGVIRMVSFFQFSVSNMQRNSIIAAGILVFYSAITVLDGDIAPIAFMFLMIALDSIREGETELAGIMLAFATIKFNVTLLPILWICIWCLNHHRGGIVAWMGMILVLLHLIGMLFMTNWFVENLRSLVYYIKYQGPTNLASVISGWQPELGGRIGWALSIILIVLMVFEWVLNAGKEENAFEWVLAMTFTVNFLCGIPNIGKNLFALILPMCYNMNKMTLRWGKRGEIYSLILGIGYLVIPWAFQILIAYHWYNPVSVLNLIFPAVLLFLLYWNRWWIIDTFIDEY